MEELERRKGVDRRRQERRKYEHNTPEYKQLEYELKCKNIEIQQLKDEIHNMNDNLFGH